MSWWQWAGICLASSFLGNLLFWALAFVVAYCVERWGDKWEVPKGAKLTE